MVHVPSLTLKYCTLVSSPVAPSLTCPRVLRSRVADVEYFKRRLRVLSNSNMKVFMSTSMVASRLWGDHAPNNILYDSCDNNRTPYGRWCSSARVHLLCSLSEESFFFNKSDRRAADYINKKKCPDWTGNTTGGVYNLRQQLRMTKPNSTKSN